MEVFRDPLRTQPGVIHRTILVGDRHVVVGDAVEEERPYIEDPSLLLPEHDPGSIPVDRLDRRASRIVDASMATIDGVRELALSLPRTHEALVRDRVKFRVGRIVYLAFSRDETLMGFAFPKEEREALIASEPDKFMMPKRSDLRYNWVVVRLSAIDDIEMREIVLEAWRMVVPKRVAAAHLGE